MSVATSLAPLAAWRITTRDPLAWLRNWHAELRRRNRALAIAGETFVLLAVAMLAAMAVDERLLYGVSVWTKPFKFFASLAIYAWTLAWLFAYLPPDRQRGRAGAALTWLPIAAAALEMAYIVFRAAQGEASHFNRSSAFAAIAYSAMGAVAVVLVAVALWYGLILARRGNPALPPAFRWSVAAGLVLTFVLGGGAGIVLGGMEGHWVGGTASDADGVPVLGWSRDGGDLRVAHFFGMHAMQVLPLLGWALADLARAPARAAVGLAGLAYATITAATFVQALNGQPFLPA
jgi:hypothetical protein